MAGSFSTGACGACARAKRRCGKQTPRCQRCDRRGVECKYPPKKPTCFIICEQEEAFPVFQSVVPYNNHLYPPVRSLSPTIKQTDFAGTPLYPSPVGSSQCLFDIAIASSWFASPETWTVGRFPKVEGVSFSIADLRRYIRRILQWLTQWVDKGSNEFIHPQLYSNRFPRSIQDAYMALSCYVRRTKVNEQIIFRTIEDRAKGLVDEYTSSPTNPWPRLTDPLENLARVQALLVYQVICLYDGDIRLRHLAETHIPILTTWVHEMIEQVSQTPCLGLSLISPAHSQSSIDDYNQISSHSCDLLWYSYILSESTRRTRFIASSLQTIYAMIQMGQIFSCPGSVMFSTRKGIWEARSAREWEELCSEVSVGFVSLEESERLFVEAKPDEVNNFSKVFLEAAFGIERVERWAGPVTLEHV